MPRPSPGEQRPIYVLHPERIALKMFRTLSASAWQKKTPTLGRIFRYGSRFLPGSTGIAAAKLMAEVFGLLPPDDVKPHERPPEMRLNKGLSEVRFEFDPQSVFFTGRSININNIQDVVRMGRFFSGTKNYLAALQPDILPKKILCPS